MANSRIKRVYDVENKTLTFNLLETDEAIVVSLNDIPAELHVELALRGLNSCVGDTAASKNADAKTVIEGKYNNLKEGVFTTRGSGGGGASTILARAIAVVTGEEVADVVAKIAVTSKEDKAKHTKHPAVAKEIATIKAADAKAKLKTTSAAAKGSEDFTF